MRVSTHVGGVVSRSPRTVAILRTTILLYAVSFSATLGSPISHPVHVEDDLNSESSPWTIAFVSAQNGPRIMTSGALVAVQLALISAHIPRYFAQVSPCIKPKFGPRCRDRGATSGQQRSPRESPLSPPRNDWSYESES
jgi:hypothetical protein